MVTIRTAAQIERAVLDEALEQLANGWTPAEVAHVLADAAPVIEDLRAFTRPLFDTSCQCDIDYACSFPPCRADRDAEQAHHARAFRSVPATAISFDEWNDVYRHDTGKQLAYATHGGTR